MSLLIETKELVKVERKYTISIIANLYSIEIGKEYADIGFSTLYEYCTKGLEYSESQASVRVNCVRLIKKHPLILDYLRNGDISPSSASRIQSYFYKNPAKPEEEKSFIESAKGKSTRETISMIQYNMGQNYHEHAKRILLSERLIRKINRITQILGDINEIELLEILLDEKIEEIERSKDRKTETGSSFQRYIPRSVKEKVNERAKGQCEFISKDGNRCQCRTNLQYDHIRPIAIGGNSNFENIQRLCFTHNQLKNLKAKNSYNSFPNQNFLQDFPKTNFDKTYGHMVNSSA